MSTETADAPYLNPDLPPAERAADLVGRMNLYEQVSQMVHEAPAIRRLGVPAYNWWNECLHGVGRAGIATVFPQAIGLAATWDTDLMQRVATCISDEARAKHHAALSPEGDSEWYFGLTYWSPNINLFRDPRWGRGQETYGEDPYLTARLGVAFVRGLQGDDPQYLKVVATPKHYAVHSGPEKDRHGFDAQVSQRDLRESYLPAFRACVQEGGAFSVMSAYNRTNGEACSASPTLLGRILREEWGFRGYVVSDCGAIDDVYAHHKVAGSPEEAAALSVRNGCELNCGCTYEALVRAVQQGLISEDEIRQAAEKLFEARFRLGMFDPPERVPYAAIPLSINDCEAHRELAREAAGKSLVLLKNDGALPLVAPKRIAVIGPNADDLDTLLGNYNGTPSAAVTPLAGIKARAGEDVEVTWTEGCTLTGPSREGFAAAVEAAKAAEVAVVVLGVAPSLEGEEGEVNLLDPSGDRTDIGLPGVQEELLREVVATGTPVVLVLHGGSALAVNWAQENVGAILMSWYGGEEAGTALAEALFGDENPGGRLPVTFYRSLGDVPAFEDYAMEGRTYRFFRGEPLYPFGFGLSYTQFEYTDLTLSDETLETGGTLHVSATITNVGERAGDEVAQLYIRHLQAPVPIPLRALAGLTRVHLAPGQQVTVGFSIKPHQMAIYADDGRPMVEPGSLEVTVGGGQPIAATASYQKGCIRIVGERLLLD